MADEENTRLYKPTLVAFMSYNDRNDYTNDFVFTQEHLAEVDDADVVAWFNSKAYGTDVPSPDARPIGTRSNTLLYYKKALSHFMPNRNHQWNELTRAGNPTKSQAVNDLIKRVKKFEAHRQGAAPKIRCPLRESEFRSAISELRKHDDNIIVKYGIPALLAFQFPLIGRTDCCAKWMRENVGMHDTYPDKAMKAQLSWSKNVHEERDAPWQHIFGCFDPVFCVILNLSLWLEMFHSTMMHG